MSIVKQETKQESKKLDLKRMRDRDRQLVTGKFIFHEVPGGSIKFPYRAYAQDQTETFTLTDGQIYKIPLGVARHLNKNCWYPVHRYVEDENKHMNIKVGQKVRRCSFQSLEFIDEDDTSPVGGSNIMTVEHTI